jgi:chromosome segregation ATPase
MAYMHNEQARLEAESQAAGAEITNLTARSQAQQAAVAAGQARASAARDGLAAAQARIPNLEAAAATADQRVADLDSQIDAHLTNEPESTIEIPNKPPRPNPAWRAWKRELDRLSQQRDQLQADAAAAHARLNDGRSQVSQATAQVQAAERQVADAISALNSIQQAIAAAQERQAAAQQQRALLDQWNEEIVRDPLARETLEPVAAILSDHAMVLEDAHATAQVQGEIAEETLAALIARRDQLTAALNDVNAQLPAASEELRAANQALVSATRRIQMLLRQGPRP